MWGIGSRTKTWMKPPDQQRNSEEELVTARARVTSCNQAMERRSAAAILETIKSNRDGQENPNEPPDKRVLKTSRYVGQPACKAAAGCLCSQRGVRGCECVFTPCPLV